MTNPYTPPTSDVQVGDRLANKPSALGVKIGMVVFAVVVSIPIALLFGSFLVDALRDDVITQPGYMASRFIIVAALFCTQTGIALIAGAYMGNQIERGGFLRTSISQAIVALIWSLLFIIIAESIFNPGGYIANPLEEILNRLNSSPTQLVLDLGMTSLIFLSITVFNSVITWIVLHRVRRGGLMARIINRLRIY